MKLGNCRKRNERYLLEVKVQSQERTRRLLRLGGTLLVAAAVLSLTSYGLYRLAKFTAYRLVFANPRFSLVDVTVESNGVLTRELVTRFAGMRVGQNVFALDLDQARRNVEMIPLVRQVEVRRLLPNRVLIHVDERVPVARLQAPAMGSSDLAYWVDRDGFVIKPLKLADGTVVRPQLPRSLPVLTGLKLTDVRVGKRVESEQMHRALALLERLEQSGAGAVVEAEQMDVSKPRQLVLSTRQRTVVKFDTEDFVPQLRRLAVILSWAQQRQKSIKSVDLTVNRGVPVAFYN
jgi:cell division protein FtsQ